MLLYSYSKFLIDNTGRSMDYATVTITKESDGLPATIYSDQAGLFPIDNPFITGAGGQVEFFVIQGSYRLQATTADYALDLRAIQVGVITEFEISDDSLSAFRIFEGTNQYINIFTQNGNEAILFGDTAINPDYIFNGNGGVGINTSTPNTNLAVAGNISAAVSNSVTSAVTLTAATSSRYIRASDAAGSFTITLPSASLASGIEYTFFKTNSSTNTITIDANGAQTIDGFLSLLLYSQRDFLTIVSDGSEWRIKDYFASGTFSPTIQGSTTPGSHTYSATRFGKFTRIRHQVFINILVELTAKDAAMAGNVQIGNLPFTCASGTQNTSSCSFFLTSNVDLTAGYTQFGGAVVSAQNYVAFIQLGDNVAAANLTAAAISNTTRIDLSTSYSVL